MVGVLIGVIVIYLFFFILTRKVWVRVIKDNKLKIQLHLPLLALHLTVDEKSKRKTKGKNDLGARSYLKIIANTLDKIKDCEVVIKRVILPCNTQNFGSLTLVNPFAYQGLIYTAIAYLKTKAKRLSLEDNAIISSPDVRNTQFYITMKLRLFQLINAIYKFRRGIKEEKIKVKGK